jgi:adenosyl cobinamide kinase/adenosyl cobinamide phosphate guanylyltransferase
MILIIGGKGQGKLDYVLQKTGLSREQVAETLSTDKPVIYHLEQIVRNTPKLSVDDLPDGILICDEIGCGVVPMSPEERDWRERTGRLCCAIAQRSDRVERIFCGIPMVLKGEGSWS